MLVGATLGALLGVAVSRSLPGRLRRALTQAVEQRAAHLEASVDARQRALNVLAGTPPSEATIRIFQAAFPEFVSVGTFSPVRNSGLTLEARCTDGRTLSATLSNAWLDAELKRGATPSKATRYVVASNQGVHSRQKVVPSGSTNEPWSDGEVYISEEKSMSGVPGLRLVGGVPTSYLSQIQTQVNLGCAVLGLLLGTLAGTAAWVGSARATRRLRLMNLALERRVSERTAELRNAESAYRGIFEHVPLGLYESDPEGRFIRVNSALAMLFGYGSPESMTQDIPGLLEIGGEARAEFLTRLNEQGTVQSEPMRILRADGEERWVAESARAVRDEEGKIARIEGAIADVTGQREVEQRLVRLGETDALTGLPNRRGLATAASQADGPVGVIALDVDRFKEFNDQHGHLAGDRALQAVSDALRHAARSDDTVARSGGEEFVVILPNTSEREALIVAERLRKAVAKCCLAEGNLTVSGGVAVAMSSADLGDAMLAADKALYQAKRQGRDRIVVNGASLA